ncbi:response regulator [Oceanobacter mangrovi]|uniref:response regulator n=1 Tax=Oceanobacter mangrovi TaxID=2862510 RepID=UPI001C8E5E75|nr:response regulator [Oceanobacter mangrovi]
MVSIRRWSIRMRIMLVGTVPVLLVALLITGYHMIQRWAELQRETDTLTRIALENIAASAEYPLFSGNYDLLAPLVTATLKQPALAGVQVLDPNGEVVFSRRTERYEEIPVTDIRIVEGNILQDVPILDTFEEPGPGGVQQQVIGSVRIEIADTFNRRRQDAIMYQSLLVGLGVVMVSIVVAGAISTTIIPPLEKLTGFIGQLAAGDSRDRIEVDNGAEIGNLQQGANQLAESLEQAQLSQNRYTARLKQEQQKSLLASQAKSEFLALMSHELRTPINGAGGMLQLMALDNSPADFNEYKHMAEQSLTHLSQLLEDVLVVVDTEKRNLPVSFGEHLLPDVLDTLLKELTPRALASRLSFVVEFDELLQHEKIRIDPSLIRQVVRHVADNALKFTRSGYVVLRMSLHPQQDHHWLSIQVIDTGIGIPLDKRQKVMEAFAQANSSFSRQYDGMGLGLTISQHICHILGGAIALGDNPGGGTVVTINLPVKMASAAPPIVTAGLPKGLQVLVVEDNGVNLRVAEKMLQKLCPDVLVTAAESGERCLALLQQQTFDLILMDCQMPGLDGFETTQAIRQQGLTMPVVACTANGSEDVYQRCLAAGMNDFLAKPVSLKTMQEMLHKWTAVGSA